MAAPEYSLMQSAPGPETVIDGRRYLYFGGTGYLGLAGHPEVIEAACSATRRYGLHSATSRAGAGTAPPVQEVERLAARFFGQEDAFYFASGYAASHVMIAALGRDIDTILIEETAHPSAVEASRLAGKPIRIFRQSDPNDLQDKLRGAGRILMAADAVSPATGTVAPVAEFIGSLQGREPSVLLLDDAHGIGVLGDQGRGLLETEHYWERANGAVSEQGVTINVCGTLAKAVGGFGGIVPGTREFVARARHSSHYFDGSSAPASAVAAGTAKALEIILRQPELRAALRANTQRVRQGLRDMGLKVPHGDTAHFGVSTGDANEMRHLCAALQQRGVFVPYLSAYRGVPPEGLIRFAVFANHSFEQIDRLLSECKSLL